MQKPLFAANLVKVAEWCAGTPVAQTRCSRFSALLMAVWQNQRIRHQHYWWERADQGHPSCQSNDQRRGCEGHACRLDSVKVTPLARFTAGQKVSTIADSTTLDF